MMEPRKEISMGEFQARCSKVGRSPSPSRPWRCPHYPRHPSPERRAPDSPSKPPPRGVRLTMEEMQERVMQSVRLGRQQPWSESLPAHLLDLEPAAPKPGESPRSDGRGRRARKIQVPKDDVDLFQDKWTGEKTEWKDWISELCVTANEPQSMRFGREEENMSIPLVEISEVAFLGGRLYVSEVAGSDSESGESSDDDDDPEAARRKRLQARAQEFTNTKPAPKKDLKRKDSESPKAKGAKAKTKK